MSNNNTKTIRPPLKDWPASVTLTREVGNYIITATAGLHKLEGNERPYFSVTAQDNNGCCGAMPETLLSHFPELAPIIALHFADANGAPMHAVANGHYWLGMSAHQEYHPQNVAAHFRITLEQADALREACVCAKHNHTAETEQERTTAVVQRVCDAQAVRWKSEADAAMCYLTDKVKGEG